MIKKEMLLESQKLGGNKYWKKEKEKNWKLKLKKCQKIVKNYTDNLLDWESKQKMLKEIIKNSFKRKLDLFHD